MKGRLERAEGWGPLAFLCPINNKDKKIARWCLDPKQACFIVGKTVTYFSPEFGGGAREKGRNITSSVTLNL